MSRDSDGDSGRVLLVLGTPGYPLSHLGTPGESSFSWGHPDVPCPIWGHPEAPPGDTRMSLLLPGDTDMSPILLEDTWMSFLLGTSGTPGCPLSHLGTLRMSPSWSKDTGGGLVTPAPVPPINPTDTLSPRPITGRWGHGKGHGDTRGQGHPHPIWRTPGGGMSPNCPHQRTWDCPQCPQGHLAGCSQAMG